MSDHIIPDRSTDPKSLVGLYVIDTAPLNSEPHYVVKRIEGAARCRAGHLTYVDARLVSVDADGYVRNASRNIRSLAFIPRAFYGSAVEAQRNADRANEARDIYLSLYRECSLKGAEFHAFCDRHENHIKSIIDGRIG